MNRAAALALLLSLAPSVLRAQEPLRLEVRDALNGAPVPHAAVRAAGLARPAYTDYVGVARLGALPRPASVTVASIGFRPETVTVASGVRNIRVNLERPGIVLRDLAVTSANLNLAPAAMGAWVLPAAALQRVPNAIEADPLRALAAVPSVSFSSLLSSRPSVRGYDAADGTVRLNGFELVNPYHIGRVFSTLPVSALAGLTVSPHVTSASDGGALGAVIDLDGRASASQRKVEADAALGIASLSGAVARSAPDMVVAARMGLLGGVTELVGEGVPYDFVDVYGRARLPVAGLAWDLTAFVTSDDYGDTNRGSGMDWSNYLLGSRIRLLDNSTSELDVSASINQFQLNGIAIESPGRRVDLSNDLRHVAVGLEGHTSRGPARLLGGVSVTRRAFESRLSNTGDGTPLIDAEARFTEVGPFAEVQLEAPEVLFSAGVRLDAAGSVRAWQPRASISIRPSESVALSLAVARSARLYREVTDPMPEPTLSFYDIWLEAGNDGVPIPRIDHASLALDARAGGLELHGGMFASRGEGLGEVTPAWEQTTDESLMRFGDSRARGIELRVAQRDRSGASGWAVSYVLSKSERRWTEAWVPWRLDRKHQFRVMADRWLGSRWQVFGLGTCSSGLPVTPVESLVWPDGSVLTGGVGRPQPRYQFGPEGSARGGATGHIDIGARFAFGGPWDSEASLAFSITNVAFGPVAPRVPVDPADLVDAQGRPGSFVTYDRAFEVPAVPSVMLNISF